MRPSEAGVEEFRRLYKEGTGKDISLDDAREMARRVLTLYELLARPLPEEAEALRRTGPDRTAPSQ